MFMALTRLETKLLHFEIVSFFFCFSLNSVFVEIPKIKSALTKMNQRGCLARLMQVLRKRLMI